MTLKVLGLVPQPRASASGRYRAYQLAAALREHGVELDIRPLLDEKGLERLYRKGRVLEKGLDLVRGMKRRLGDVGRARDYGLAFVHREAWPVIGFEVDRWLAKRGIGWVYDFDDAVWIPNVSEANRLFSAIKPFGQPSRLAAGARAVSAGNAWLAEWARRQRPGRPEDEVQVIPTAVDTDLWRPRPRGEGPPRLVWIGSPSTGPFLEPLRPVIDRLARRHPGLELHVIGARFETANPTVVFHPWSADTEIDIASGCDIGLAPLPDNEWSRGKCGLKLLLYMALGLPGVASPVGVHREILDHRENGWLAAGPEAFEEGIDTLLREPDLRTRLGKAARATVEERYSIRAVAPRLAALMHRAASRN